MLITVIWVLLLLAVFFIFVMAVDCNRFVIKEYEINSGKLRKDETIVLLSDLHSKSFGQNNEKLKTAVDRIKPDVILIAGDMYTASKYDDAKVAEDIVEYLAGKYPVYYGNGNHEHKTRIAPEIFGNTYAAYAEKIKHAGVCHLVNEKVNRPVSNMEIYGAEIDRDYFAKFKMVPMDSGYMKRMLGTPDENRFSVLIAHNPDYFKDYADWGADLVVSGHVHGGLMQLPLLGGVISPTLRLFPKYDGGVFREGNSAMILSRGLGTHTLPIRIFNPGELVVIRCRAEGTKGGRDKIPKS